MYKLKLTKIKIIIGSMLCALIIGYFAANYIALTLLQHKLNQNPDYQISIQSVHLNPFIGSYHINNFLVHETNYPKAVYFSVDSIVLKIQWQALVFHARLVGKVILNQPVLNYVKRPAQQEPTPSIYQQWDFFTKNIFPLGLNAVAINNGTISYTYFDQQKKPITTKIFNLNAELTNGSCVLSCKNLGAQLAVSAQLASQGQFYGLVDFDPDSKSPNALLRAKVENLDLKDYRAIISEQTELKLQQGFANLYTQIRLQNNVMNGYVKIFLRKIDVQPQHENIFNKIKANIVQGIVNLFKNDNTNESATTIPIKGKVNNPQASLWESISNALHHAFTSALQHGLKKP